MSTGINSLSDLRSREAASPEYRVGDRLNTSLTSEVGPLVWLITEQYDDATFGGVLSSVDGLPTDYIEEIRAVDVARLGWSLLPGEGVNSKPEMSE
jgi:hypothetical protein